jgi:gamma-glutamyltranspeptidase/glutathione hydrolase
VEAMRRAYRDRADYLGDSDVVEVSVDHLLSRQHAAYLASDIDLNSASANDTLVHRSEGMDTTHFSIVDKQGNRVSATLSINYPFGSGFVPPGTGVLLNDEMDDFSASPGEPNVYGLVGSEANAIAPGKRMLSSMSPTMVEDDQGIAILGTPGGSRIITMVLLAILEMEKTSDPAAWVNLPRYHHQYLPDIIQYEPEALSESQAEQLKAMGHRLERLENSYGNMHAIYQDKQSGKVTAASDKRGIGQAISTSR